MRRITNVRLASRLAAIVLSCALMFSASSLSAQATAPSRWSVAVVGGVARTSQGLGYNSLVAAELRTVFRPVRLRLEGLRADWGGGQQSSILALTSTLLVAPLAEARISPYALAGAGAYDAPGAGPVFGYTLGLGIRLPIERRALLIETRLHSIQSSGYEFPPVYGTLSRDKWRALWLPINFGFQF